MKTDKEAAEEILADEFQANLKDTADLQLQVTLNPDVERIIRAMLKLCKHKEESRWIPVTERLPEHNQQVIFKLKDNSIRLGRFLKNDQWESPNMFCDGSFHHLEDIKGWMLAPV